MADVQGFADPRFDRLRELLSGTLDSGDDLGASVSVTLGGEPVVDIWGGHADQDKTKAWEKDTITNVWSTTKTMTTLAALVLIDQGGLDTHAPVASYWPEFAANGKDKIEVRHLMGHTSGVSGWAQPVVVEDLYDWDKSTSMLAGQAHGTDLVLGVPVRFGTGYALPSEASPFLPDGRICYWGGWGGSAIIVDVDRHMTFAYVMNRMAEGLLGDPRGEGLIRATYDIVG